MKKNYLVITVGAILGLLLAAIWFYLYGKYLSIPENIYYVTDPGNRLKDSAKLLPLYRKLGDKFEIEKYESDWLFVDIFHECSSYIQQRSQGRFNTGSFLTNEIQSTIDFSKRIDCTDSKNGNYCSFLNKHTQSDIMTMKEVRFWLYALYAGDMNYDTFKSLFTNHALVRLPQSWADMQYVDYYSQIIIGKINNKEDCIRFIARKWNSLLD